MSNIYVQEPPSNGKVLLITSAGDVDVELWSKEAPLACRNFVQLCMEGYYDGTIFHRVVPNFIVQGGDPEGTGRGGSSVYGQPFKDEFHSRLRFVRRGLVAMANEGANSNGSQFFITLAATPELTKKHTIFGKVAGDTVFNMLKLGDVETDSDERPLYPHKIVKTKILLNPFDDIVPRVVLTDKTASETKERESRSKATKNFKLLSFGEEAEEDEVDLTRAAIKKSDKGKSSHDLLKDETLSHVPAIPQSDRASSIESSPTSSRVTVKLDEEEMKISGSAKSERTSGERVRHKEGTAEDNDDSKNVVAEGASKKLTLKQSASKAQVDDSFSNSRAKSTGSGKESKEAATLAMWEKFRAKLTSAKESSSETGGPLVDARPADDKDDDSIAAFCTHKLQFDTHEQNAKDANVYDADRYEIYDPRNPITKRRREPANKESSKHEKRKKDSD